MPAAISWTCPVNPEISHRHENGKWRALIGWTHANDTLDGLQEGKVWCWVSEIPEKLQLFDSEFNRSYKRGEIQDCGVANFTMVRMFHPYWTHSGKVPKDGVADDKKRCRLKYHELIRKHRLTLGPSGDEEPGEYAKRIAAEKSERQKKRKSQVELRHQTAQARKEQRLRQQRECEDALPGIVEIVTGGFVHDPMLVDGDEENSKHNAGTMSRQMTDGLTGSGSQMNPIDLD